jgi:hypothetical protein
MKEFRKYIKKPLVIQAKQMDVDFEVETLEGMMKGKSGDYLVYGIKREQYPVRKDIFEETYQAIDEEDICISCSKRAMSSHHENLCDDCAQAEAQQEEFIEEETLRNLTDEEKLRY